MSYFYLEAVKVGLAYHLPGNVGFKKYIFSHFFSNVNIYSDESITDKCAKSSISSQWLEKCIFLLTTTELTSANTACDLTLRSKPAGMVIEAATSTPRFWTICFKIGYCYDRLYLPLASP